MFFAPFLLYRKLCPLQTVLLEYFMFTYLSDLEYFMTALLEYIDLFSSLFISAIFKYILPITNIIDMATLVPIPILI